MSNLTNEALLERARQIAEDYTGTPLEDAVLFNIERNDLETLAQIVKETEDHWFAEIAADLKLKEYDETH